jgi:glyoxylate/hydroxypyruvate reductase
MPTKLLREYASKGKIQLVQWQPPSSSSSNKDEEVDDRIPAPREWLLENIKDASGLVVVIGDQVDEDLIDAAEKPENPLELKVVATMSVGYDHINKALLKERGVRLGYSASHLPHPFCTLLNSSFPSRAAPNILNAAVADLTLLLALSIMRQIPHAARLARTGQWSDFPWSPLAFCGPSLAGKTVGFFGFGAIAQTLCLRLVPFGIKRVVFTASKPKQFNVKDKYFKVLTTGDTGEILPGSTTSETIKTAPFPHAQIPVQNIPSLHDMAAEADVLFVLASASPQTYHAINRSVFMRMKRSAVVVNTSRGTLVDTDGLVNALKEGRIAGAGLDVLEGEPSTLCPFPFHASSSADTCSLLSQTSQQPTRSSPTNQSKIKSCYSRTSAPRRSKQDAQWQT